MTNDKVRQDFEAWCWEEGFNPEMYPAIQWKKVWEAADARGRAAERAEIVAKLDAATDRSNYTWSKRGEDCSQDWHNEMAIERAIKAKAAITKILEVI